MNSSYIVLYVTLSVLRTINHEKKLDCCNPSYKMVNVCYLNQQVWVRSAHHMHNTTTHYCLFALIHISKVIEHVHISWQKQKITIYASIQKEAGTNNKSTALHNRKQSLTLLMHHHPSSPVQLSNNQTDSSTGLNTLLDIAHNNPPEFLAFLNWSAQAIISTCLCVQTHTYIHRSAD